MTFLKKLKIAYLLLKTKRFVFIFVKDNKDPDEKLDWRAWGFYLEEVPIICDVTAEEIEGIMQQYADEDMAERVGDDMINMIHLN